MIDSVIRLLPGATPVFDQSMAVYQEQARIIKEMAQRSDCVIVGRCGDYILEEYNPFRIFVCADMESGGTACGSPLRLMAAHTRFC